MTRNADGTRWYHFAIAAITVVVGLVLLGMSDPVQASDVGTAPIGGCKEVVQDHMVYADTPGARDCRKAGWIVRPRLVVGPHGWVKFSRLPHCAVEDASYGPVPCSWNFHGADGADGNGHGKAFYVLSEHRDWYYFVYVGRNADVW